MPHSFPLSDQEVKSCLDDPVPAPARPRAMGLRSLDLSDQALLRSEGMLPGARLTRLPDGSDTDDGPGRPDADLDRGTTSPAGVEGSAAGPSERRSPRSRGSWTHAGPRPPASRRDAPGSSSSSSTTIDGVTGVGTAGFGNPASVEILRQLEPLVVGRSPSEVAARLGVDVPGDSEHRAARRRDALDQCRRHRALGPVREAARRAGVRRCSAARSGPRYPRTRAGCTRRRTSTRSPPRPPRGRRRASRR